ncbi:hypothetical protein HMPREF9440_01338 [Sutterella parvirubra YIT 11816]|uniref:Uncharacterized protein n=1 Tax=Sutterella parvirubra YIT 11816 TaxID=762967 RepID=H3KF21_9BURK|nr:hypothetical protein HMPREF9440_01338 [Sutterella parvirubra YIT 11816]
MRNGAERLRFFRRQFLEKRVRADAPRAFGFRVLRSRAELPSTPPAFA